MSELKDDFRRHLELNIPELKNSKVLLAISGGLDSVSLCHLLMGCDVELFLAHCNFQLRGEESLKDEQLIEKMADRFNLELHIQRFNTLSYATENNLSIQMAARDLRYAWFDDLLKENHYDYLVTAHHADDNLETFFINLSRGSGIEGLTGIPEKNDKTIRPLLPFSRKEIEAYAHAHDIEWREDQSNAENAYLRNRIRNELMPVLKTVLPSLPKNIKKTLSHLKEAHLVLEDKIEEIQAQVVELGPKITKIDIDRLRSLEYPRFYLFHILGNYGFNQWDDIESLLEAQSGKMVFSDSHRLLKDREMLWLQKLSDLPSEEALYSISELDTSVELDRITLTLERIDSVKTVDSRVFLKEGKRLVFFDLDQLIFPLIVRKWQKGDYFIPKGMTGRKKLSKYFKDEKLSVAEKENIWLLCSGDNVIWIIGHRADERFKITQKTKRVLKTEMIDIE